MVVDSSALLSKYLDDKEGNSLKFMQRMIYLIFSEVVYQRELLPRDDFTEKYVFGNSLHVPNQSRDRRQIALHNHLKGAAEALTDKKLKAYHLMVHKDREDPSAADEVFIMDVIYADEENGEASMQMSCGEIPEVRVRYGGVEQLQQQARDVFRSLRRGLSTLEPITRNVSFSFYITYRDGVDRSYHPAGYGQAARMYDLPQSAEIGDMGMLHAREHACLLKVKSVMLEDGFQLMQRNVATQHSDTQPASADPSQDGTSEGLSSDMASSLGIFDFQSEWEDEERPRDQRETAKRDQRSLTAASARTLKFEQSASVSLDQSMQSDDASVDTGKETRGSPGPDQPTLTALDVEIEEKDKRAQELKIRKSLRGEARKKIVDHTWAGVVLGSSSRSSASVPQSDASEDTDRETDRKTRGKDLLNEAMDESVASMGLGRGRSPALDQSAQSSDASTEERGKTKRAARREKERAKEKAAATRREKSPTPLDQSLDASEASAELGTATADDFFEAEQSHGGATDVAGNTTAETNVISTFASTVSIVTKKLAAADKRREEEKKEEEEEEKREEKEKSASPISAPSVLSDRSHSSIDASSEGSQKEVAPVRRVSLRKRQSLTKVPEPSTESSDEPAAEEREEDPAPPPPPAAPAKEKKAPSSSAKDADSERSADTVKVERRRSARRKGSIEQPATVPEEEKEADEEVEAPPQKKAKVQRGRKSADTQDDQDSQKSTGRKGRSATRAAAKDAETPREESMDTDDKSDSQKSTGRKGRSATRAAAKEKDSVTPREKSNTEDSDKSAGRKARSATRAAAKDTVTPREESMDTDDKSDSQKSTGRKGRSATRAAAKETPREESVDTDPSESQKSSGRKGRSATRAAAKEKDTVTPREKSNTEDSDKSAGRKVRSATRAAAKDTVTPREESMDTDQSDSQKSSGRKSAIVDTPKRGRKSQEEPPKEVRTPGEAIKKFKYSQDRLTVAETTMENM